jgi:glycosyltransferase involved in cell wall biosynthesis
MFLERQLHKLYKKMQKIAREKKQQKEWPVEKPLVSVIIPCYNYGKFINGAIESVLAQTFQRFEIIVINDGSTDELTKDVLRNLCYEKTVTIHQENQGLSQARNNGAAMAAGKYICYLDADDFIKPTYLEKTLSVIESDESLGSCYSWVQCFGDVDSVWETEDLDPFFLRQYTTASSHSVIRKEAWERVKEQNGSGFLSKYDGYFEDWVFWIDMVQCGYRGQVIKEPLIRYRVHKGSLGATHKAGFDDMLKILHKDRKDFFYDRSYARELMKKLSKRIYITNNRVNLIGASKWIEQKPKKCCTHVQLSS